MKLTLALLLFSLAAISQEAYDTVLLGGKIIDGTGNSWFYGDLAIRGNRIAKITPAGLLNQAPAREKIDARGMVVAPGFVDIQGGLGGRSISKITQGVTTEITGEGWTLAPANDLTRAGSESIGRRGNETKYDGPHGFDALLKANEMKGSAVNFGSFVGATTVRQYVKGKAPGKATPTEIKAMQELVG
jgi:N-acyl-D-amino-acid deacylase